MIVLAWRGLGLWDDVGGGELVGGGGLGWMSSSSAKRTALVAGGFGDLLAPLLAK